MTFEKNKSWSVNTLRKGSKVFLGRRQKVRFLSFSREHPFPHTVNAPSTFPFRAQLNLPVEDFQALGWTRTSATSGFLHHLHADILCRYSIRFNELKHLLPEPHWEEFSRSLPYTNTWTHSRVIQEWKPSSRLSVENEIFVPITSPEGNGKTTICYLGHRQHSKPTSLGGACYF